MLPAVRPVFVSVVAISTEKNVTDAGNCSTTSLLARVATAIRLGSAPPSKVVELCRLANFASAKIVSRAEFATVANRCSGIYKRLIQRVAKVQNTKTKYKIKIIMITNIFKNTVFWFVDCQCYIPGVIGNIGECNSKSGQCNCKPSVTERSCSECVDGTYNIQESNVFGCTGKILKYFLNWNKLKSCKFWDFKNFKTFKNFNYKIVLW